MSETKSALGGGLFGKESAVYDVYLNLTPLMDVMSNLLFFLLAAFGASVIAVLQTTVPVRSEDESSIDTAMDKVTVTLQVNAAGFTVNCESGTIPEEQLTAYGAQIAKRGADYDNVTLNGHLKRIKDRFPASKTIVMVPDDNIRYQVLVDIMDHARDWTGPDKVKRVLFPEVVMSGVDPRALVAPAAPAAPAPVAPAPAPPPPVGP
jgi:biopolymer transport protein ExbD